MKAAPAKIRGFQTIIWQHYASAGRDFPWRRTTVPYRIVVSEVMLQQTQTERVVGYYKRFLRRFPTLKALAHEPLAAVLVEWQGLGYNRRARYLWQFAKQISENMGGKIPRDVDRLEQLPGIGSYTARAICAFAFNQPHPLIETNIRAVYIDYFFKKTAGVKDQDLLPLIAETIDSSNPREWFYALMDYGSELKKRDRSLTRRSAHYVKQSTFRGSRREVRGLVIKSLAVHTTLSLDEIVDKTEKDRELVAEIVATLEREKFIKKKRSKYILFGR